MRTVASGPSAVLVDTVPIFAALFGFLFLHEHLGVWAVGGIALAFIDLVLIGSGRPVPPTLPSDRAQLTYHRRRDHELAGVP